jgi:hypothetical protein
MKRGLIGALTAGVLILMPVTDASAQPDREGFSVDMLVTGVTNDPEPRETPNGKWVFFEGKYVESEGVATIGTTQYDDVVLEATLWGKLSPDGTIGTEWGTFTLSLDPGDLECHGTLKVKRYVATAGPVPYGEAGKFQADCDDGAKVMGNFVGEFGELDGVPGFVVTMDGMAR